MKKRLYKCSSSPAHTHMHTPLYLACVSNFFHNIYLILCNVCVSVNGPYYQITVEPSCPVKSRQSEKGERISKGVVYRKCNSTKQYWRWRWSAPELGGFKIIKEDLKAIQSKSQKERKKTLRNFGTFLMIILKAIRKKIQKLQCPYEKKKKKES